MAEPDRTLRVVRCADCHGTFLPREAPCPRCGARVLDDGAIAARGVVLAATELWAPAEGWAAPHRLVLVECPELVRVLAWTSGAVPSVGSEVWVLDDTNGAYRVHAAPPSS